MTARHASCSCGQLSLVCEGEPVRVAICHCLACQRRTGSVFGAAARFRREQVGAVEGRATRYRRIADSGHAVDFRFCPDCGATVYWELAQFPEVIAVAVGAFADPAFPAPVKSVWEACRHPWAETAAGVPMEHLR